MESMGQVSYEYEAPTGFPDRSDYWLSAVSVMHRLNFAIALVENRIPDMAVHMAKLERRAHAASMDAWEKALGSVLGAANTRLVHAAPTRGSASEQTFQAYLTLLLGSPEFQHK
jgi:hypothetical protein